MNSKHLQKLPETIRRITRGIKRRFNRLFRKAEVTLGVTIAIPPFVKVEFHYKKAAPSTANDNRRSRRRRA